MPSASLLPVLIMMMTTDMTRENAIALKGVLYLSSPSRCQHIDSRIEDRRAYGRKKVSEWYPPLRAKDHSCRDAAARVAITPAVKLRISTVDMTSSAA